MNAQDFIVFAFQVAIMLACALAFGHVMRLLHQPAILGEMLGGIVLGPTILGMIASEWHAWLFHSSPAATMVRAGAVNLGMLLFLSRGRTASTNKGSRFRRVAANSSIRRLRSRHGPRWGDHR